MRITELQEGLLEIGAEDYSGLWEALAIARTKYPSMTDAELRDISKQEIRALIESGLIELYKGSTFSGEQQPVDRVDLLLTSDLSWNPPDRHEMEHVRFATTAKGKSTLARRSRGQRRST